MPTAKRNPQRFIKKRPLITSRGSYRRRRVIPFIIHELRESGGAEAALFRREGGRTEGCSTGAVSVWGEKSSQVQRKDPDGRSPRRAWRSRRQAAETSASCSASAPGGSFLQKPNYSPAAGESAAKTSMREGREWKRGSDALKLASMQFKLQEAELKGPKFQSF